MIFSLNEKNADAPALISADGMSLTYGELCVFASEMKKYVSGRCLTFVLCRNVPGAVAGYLAFLEGNVVPLLLGADLKEDQFDAFYHVYEPSYLWAPADWDIDPAVRGWDKVTETYGYCLWKTGFAPALMHESLGLLLATSGSTGNPKLVRLSRKNIEANAESICTYLELDERERPITTLPMQYTYGLSIINSHLLAGASVLMTTDSYVQQGFWEFFQAQSPTSFGGVPYTYEILKKMRVFRRPLPTLHSITQAGGKLPAALQREVAEWAKESGIRFFVMYGQTEATARMSYLPPENCLDKPGSIGIAIPGGTFSLVDDRDEPIDEIDTAGELLYKGANVSLGYAQTKADLLLGDENKGVLHTGDIAKRDADGYYYIVGRKKRFIKMFGIRIGLDACEQVLRAHFPDVEFACTGADNHMEIYGTDPGAADAAADDLSGYLRLSRKGFSAYYLPELPKNDAGKIQYQMLSAAPYSE